jgi:hypothetical protein
MVMVKSRRMRRVGLVACMGEKRCIKYFDGKT